MILQSNFSKQAFLLFMVLATMASASEPQETATNQFPSTGKPSQADFHHPHTHQHPAAVDVAILLDTSNSMDGLISQAKSQLWTIVQQFAQAEKYGESPFLRVALFEYGNTNLPVSEGYLRQVVPLSDNLDVLSEALFALTTNGGDEYCGQVIDEAITRLDWSSEPGSYKAIFIAGNEPFTQGSVDYHHPCQRAVGMGIVVNTIHCGDQQEGIQGQWKQGAQLAKGEFFNIDQDRAIVYIPCPQDNEIIRLNKELNETYLWFGSADKREYNCQNQQAQDSNAAELSPTVAVGRSISKSSKVYNNAGRDLVDALVEDEEILKNVPEEELPENMQEMTSEERTEYLDEMAAKRKELKGKISEQSSDREIFLVAERSRRAEETGGSTLGDAVVDAIRKQLVDAGFEISGADGLN